jgi:hypothetical protein
MISIFWDQERAGAWFGLSVYPACRVISSKADYQPPQSEQVETNSKVRALFYKRIESYGLLCKWHDYCIQSESWARVE